MVELKNILIAAGGAAAVAAVLYFLLREEEESEMAAAAKAASDEVEKSAAAAGGKINPAHIDRAGLMTILGDWEETQKSLRVVMKALASEISMQELTFEEVYKRVKEVMPKDPLEARGLTFADLEIPLQAFHAQGDMEVLAAFQKAVCAGQDPEQPTMTEKAKGMTMDDITEINKEMLTELEKLVTVYNAHPEKATFDKQIVGAVCRVVLDARIEAKFGVHQEDMEGAIHLHSDKLKDSASFRETYMKMQQVMEGI